METNIEKSTEIYITPNLTIYNSFDELISDKMYNVNYGISSSNAFTYSDFYTGGCFFVLGEPGVGKSTLLRKLNKEAKQASFISSLTYLPEIKHKDLELYLTETYTIRTREFYDVGRERFLFCLDSLDEVSSEEYSDMLRTIIEFNKKHPEFKLIVSCRTHYLSKNTSIIKGLQNFKYIKVQPFSNKQILNYIKEFAGEDIEAVVKEQLTGSQRNNWASILRVPRYLDIQIQLARVAESPAEFGKLKKTDFFEKFIYKKLDAEKGNYEKNILTKRVLEKLALVMEIYQTNVITKDELLTFLDETDSNINLIFLNSENIEEFIKRVLKNSDFNKIEFDNTEFQEYLAAKELLRIGEKRQILFDLILEPNFKQIYPNWFDVLKYVIEIDPNQIITVIDFLKNTTERLISEDFFTLLECVDTTKLLATQKSYVFETVFEYFQNNNLHIARNAYILSKFYTDVNEFLFKNINLIPHNTPISNQLYLIQYLLDQKVYKNKDQLLLKIKSSINTITDVVLIEQCIHILQYTGSIQNLIDIEDIRNKNIKTFTDFYRAYASLDPNSNYCFGLTIEAIEKGVDETAFIINWIDSSEIIKQLFQKWNSDKLLFDKFISLIDHHYLEDHSNLFKVISENWDSEFNDLLLNFNVHLLHSENQYELNRHSFYKSIIECLAENNKDFIRTFISIKDPFVYYEFLPFLAKHLDGSNVDSLNGFVLSDAGKALLYSLFIHLKLSVPEKYTILVPFLKLNLPDLFKKVEDHKPQQNNQNDLIALSRFSQEINVNSDRHSGNVFSTFLSNYTLILMNAPSMEIEKLKLLIRNIFKNIDTSTFRLNITKYTHDGRSFSITNKYVYQFTVYLKVAIILGIEKEFKGKRNSFIELLPILITSEDRKMVLDFIGEITPEDIKILSDFCLNRTDDFLKYSSNNFINIVSEYEIVTLLPIVKGFLTDPMVRHDEKIESIKCIAKLEDTNTSLLNYFSNYISSPKTIGLAEIANELLISKYSDVIAINWRLKELKDRKFVFVKTYSKGMQSYTSEEHELDRSTFANCLIGLRDMNLINQFNDLLAFSFTIRDKSDYHEYSNYLQRIVFFYYKELKQHNSIIPLKKLTFFFNNLDSGYKQSFKAFIKDLEIEYSESVLKPNNIIDCVKKYNNIKAKTYLPIANDFELLGLLQDIITEDLYNFVNNEGFYKTMLKANLSEDTMQKILKLQFENALNQRGFRNHDIYREPQLYNDKRPDLIVSYGFIGPVVVELKFISNADITNKKKRLAYKDKLENNYRKGFKAKHGIYLILEKDKTKDKTKLKNILRSEYSDLKEWSVAFFKCYQD